MANNAKNLRGQLGLRSSGKSSLVISVSVQHFIKQQPESVM